MDRRQIGLRLTLNAIHCPLYLEYFNERLIIQKAVYLAQAAGIQLGYYYRWYLRGPYSPTLTRDAFALKAELQEGDDPSERWKLDDESLKVAKRVARLIPAGDSADVAHKLELMASAHFLIRKGHASRDDIPGLTAKLVRFGKQCTADEVRKALDGLEKHDIHAEGSGQDTRR